MASCHVRWLGGEVAGPTWTACIAVVTLAVYGGPRRNRCSVAGVVYLRPSDERAREMVTMEKGRRE